MLFISVISPKVYLLAFSSLYFIINYLLLINKFLSIFAVEFNQTNPSMKSKTQTILVIMNVLAWITFIGLMIKAGAILVSFVMTLFNPDAAKNLYNGENLYDLRQTLFVQYLNMVSFNIALPAMEAYTAYLIIMVLSKIKLTNPFTAEVAAILERISYVIFGTWIVAMIHNAHTSWLMKKVPGLQEEMISGEFIFLAGVVFVIAQIFKRGVEIQSENELTV